MFINQQFAGVKKRNTGGEDIGQTGSAFLDVEFYFAHAYTSLGKRLNEITTVLFDNIFQRKTVLQPSQLKILIRKYLGFKRPKELFL